eukprot:7578710-Pyramimonas_sp.AAC.1
MEMLTDPMLRQWVPAWVVEQCERANPFYKEVLGAILEGGGVRNNRELLRRTRREMVRRHQARQQGRDARGGVAAGDGVGQDSD